MDSLLGEGSAICFHTKALEDRWLKYRLYEYAVAFVITIGLYSSLLYKGKQSKKSKLKAKRMSIVNVNVISTDEHSG